MVDTVDAVLRIGGTPHGLTAVGIAGVICALVALLVGTVARVGMGAAFRTNVDGTSTDGLVTTQLFALSRNPLYDVMALLALGVALLIPDLWTVLALVAAVAGLELQVRAVEEPHLLIAHGNEYRDYAARTGRFIPLLGRVR